MRRGGLGRYRLGAGRCRLALFPAALALGLAGCGGGGETAQISGTFARFVGDLERHDVAGTCSEITPAFWRAFATEVNDEAGGPAVSVANCSAGLRSLFKLAGGRQLIKGGVSVVDVSIHGRSATATESRHGFPPAPLRFVREGGRWVLDCCTGPQLEQQPQATYRVPSQSMSPTLRAGQTIVSDNQALRGHPPPLGAIVVFHAPEGAGSPTPVCGAPDEGVGFPRPCGEPTPQESSEVFIKRVVGLPGDRISILNGEVIRNGRREPRNYSIEPCTQAAICSFPDPITVPPGEYFVLGDNRAASDDSRFWGPVKRSWLIGLVKNP